MQRHVGISFFHGGADGVGVLGVGHKRMLWLCLQLLHLYSRVQSLAKWPTLRQTLHTLSLVASLRLSSTGIPRNVLQALSALVGFLALFR